jgi:quercetin dioxygenase-like cupin family protein
MRQPIVLLLGLILSTAARTQVPVQVSDEPRHHKLLANEWVRVLDVHIPPHDTTQMHKHSTPSVFIVLSNTKTGSQALVEPGKPTFADGNIWFESFQAKPRIHRVWNEDTVEFHVMDIELPHSPAAPAAPAATAATAATASRPAAPSPTSSTSAVPASAIDPPLSKLLFDAPPARVYRLTLPPGRHQVLPRSPSPILVINLSGPAIGAVNRQPFTQKGDFLFLPANTPLAVANNSSTAEQQFALLYLK